MSEVFGSERGGDEAVLWGDMPNGDCISAEEEELEKEDTR
jgi:hypothetical protein